MRTSILLSFLILVHLTIANAGEIQPIDQQGCIDPYAIINKASIIPISVAELTVRLYETGGGDPAMNGNKIILNISQWDPSGNSYTWNTGINIFELLEIRLEIGKIWLECTEHVMDNNSGSVQTMKAIYTIVYFQDGSEQLKNTIDVARQE